MSLIRAFYMLLGNSATGAVVLSDRYVSDYGASAAQAVISFQSDGRLRIKEQTYSTIAGQWLATPSTTTAALYEIRATVLSNSTNGSPGGAATGSWLALSTTRAWTVTANSSTDDTEYCTLLIEIRLASSGQVVASANIGLDASRI